MIRISVSACRKISDENYGSIGASVSIEGIEIPDSASPEEMQGRVQSWQDWCRSEVDAELDRRRGAAAGADRPATSNGHAGHPALAGPAKERDVYGSAAGPGRSGGSKGGKGGGKVPKSGGGLFAALKEFDEADEDLQITKWVSNWGKRQEFPDRMVEWDEDQVRQAYAKAMDRIEALRNSAALAAGN